MRTAAPRRRSRGRILYTAAVASFVLLLLFLWRSSDGQLVSVDGAVSAKLANGDGHKVSSGGSLDNGRMLDHESDDEEDGSHSGGDTTRPFSVPLPLPLPPVLSSTAKHAAPSHPAAIDFPPPAAPGKPATWTSSEKQRILHKPSDLTVTAIVFYGRRDRVQSLHCYLERNLVSNGGWLDNVIWVINTDDQGDLAYLEQILSRSTTRYQTHILPEPVGGPDYAKIWRTVDRETMYIKINDDIIWFADDTIERIVTTKLERQDALAVSANTINNPPLGFLHYHMGALHPYLPDVPAGFKWNTLKPVTAPAPSPPQEEADEDEEDAYAEESSPLTKRFKSFNHQSPWRPLSHPFWKGPDDFAWDIDYSPPPIQNNRWLRIEDNMALNRTPVAKLAYGTPYESWAIAAQQHYSLLENIEREQLDLYKFEKPWDMKGERIPVNFMAIMGSDILDSDVFHWPDDQGYEDMVVMKLPHDLGRPILVEGTALAAHFNFKHQPGVASTDLLARYKALAGETACLTPSPPAF